MSVRKKMLLILNPVAGKMRAQSADIPGLFSAYDCMVYTTQNSALTEEFVASHAPTYDLVVCAGGDGTLHHVVNGLMRLQTRPPLGYIPCGTTNDFAASLGIPRDIRQAASLLESNHIAPIDIGSFGDRFFTYVASFGAFTESSYKAPQENKNKLGHMAYIFEAVRDLPNLRPCRATVETEAGTYTGEYIFGSVSNSTSLGGMVRLSPDSVCYNDGLFEVLLVSMPKTPLEFQQIFFSLLRRQYNSGCVSFFKASQITFSFETPLPWSLDGEFAQGSTQIEIKNNQGAVSLLLP